MPIKFIRTEDANVLKDGWRVEMEVPNGTEIETIVDTFRMFLLGISYHPDTVKENVPSHVDMFGEPKEERALQIGDRVRFYGAFNENPEVSTGTIKSEPNRNGLVRISLDYYCGNDGLREGPIDQWAHPKQLRRLKKRA